MPVVPRHTLVRMQEWDMRHRVPVSREGMIVRLRRETRGRYARTILPRGSVRILEATPGARDHAGSGEPGGAGAADQVQHS